MKNHISIITPTYNRAYILPIAIKSVLAQTYPYWEMIIVDDGSNDNTKEVVKSFSDERVRYFAQKNKGASSARNTALSRARGQWITYLDSDNEFFPECLEVLMRWFSVHPKAFYAVPQGVKTIELYKENKPLCVKDVSHEEYPPTLTPKDIFMRKTHFDLNAFMHVRSIIDEGIRFDKNLRAFDDWDFFMQIAERHPETFLYITEPLYHYHQRYGGDGVVSNTTYQEWADGFEYIYQKHKNDLLIQGQNWYPERIITYTKMEEDYRKGKIPAPYLKYFPEYD